MLTAERVEQAYRDGARTSNDLARALNVTPRTALRWIDQVGLPGVKRERAYSSLSDEQVERIRWMLEDGVPLKWVAETVGVAHSTVSHVKGRLGLTRNDNSYAFAGVLHSIRANPILVDLHREFAPK